MNIDNDLNLHSMAEMSGWLRYWLHVVKHICKKRELQICKAGEIHVKFSYRFMSRLISMLSP